MGRECPEPCLTYYILKAKEHSKINEKQEIEKLQADEDKVLQLEAIA